jgi:hypothetical protein
MAEPSKANGQVSTSYQPLPQFLATLLIIVTMASKYLPQYHRPTIHIHMANIPVQLHRRIR